MYFYFVTLAQKSRFSILHFYSDYDVPDIEQKQFIFQIEACDLFSNKIEKFKSIYSRDGAQEQIFKKSLKSSRAPPSDDSKSILFETNYCYYKYTYYVI